ncbi:RHS repeat-associated core domain-containing protein [Candidatus Woesearchaeota archaeon]|nr:RHS repeat-associated core domain-containing protein [Candidatus Woesearchaeota archaeon]
MNNSFKVYFYAKEAIINILNNINPSVYSLSLFSNDEFLFNIELEDIKVTDNQIQLLLSNNNNKIIEGLVINIDNEIINIQIRINRYESKLISFYSKTDKPSKLIINSYYNYNHKLISNNDNIVYTFTGNEENIVNQPEQITIQENQQIQQQFNQRPSYISYSSYSKLDDNKNIIYFTKDHISSNRITTNNNGNIQYKANYQPYGEIFKETGEESYKYSNKELDSSNLYYFGARYYDPSIGRFTQVDPIFKLQESPYMYANNNPLKYIDPSGMEPLAEGISAEQREQLMKVMEFGKNNPEEFDNLMEGQGRSALTVIHYLIGEGEPYRTGLNEGEWGILLSTLYGQVSIFDKTWTPNTNPEFPATEGWEHMQIKRELGMYNEFDEMHNILGPTTTIRRRIENVDGKDYYHYMVAENFDFVQGETDKPVGGFNYGGIPLASRWIKPVAAMRARQIFSKLADAGHLKVNTGSMEASVPWLVQVGKPFRITDDIYVPIEEDH